MHGSRQNGRPGFRFPVSGSKFRHFRFLVAIGGGVLETKAEGESGAEQPLQQRVLT